MEPLAETAPSREDFPDPTLFRTAMSRLGAAVNLVTTDGPAGRYGILVSAVCSVTDDPPTVIACVNRTSGANETIKKNGVLCVNLIGRRHKAICDRFMRPQPDERFADGDWTRLNTGAPVLSDASAAIDCEIASVTEVGSHTVFVARVAALHINEILDGVVWFDKRYHYLA